MITHRLLCINQIQINIKQKKTLQVTHFKAEEKHNYHEIDTPT